MSRLCQFCSDISISRLVGNARTEFRPGAFPVNKFYPHYPSFEALEAAAESECELCRLILDCFKGTPYEVGSLWPLGWQGKSCDISESMYTQAKSLTKSDVKLSIDCRHLFADSTVDQVRVFDAILVQVGPPAASFDLEDDDSGADGADDAFPLLTLTLSVPPNTKLRVDGFKIGRFQPDPNFSSHINFDLARSWLDDCQLNHKHQIPNSVPVLPTRVIEIGTKRDPERVRVIHSHGAIANYVALSHCWGGKIEPVLTSSCMSAFEQTLPYEKLPANFRDAIIITRELGIQYLWIDSLCILQDSKTDWEQESKKMGDTYRFATVTISAMASHGSADGILLSGPRRPLDPPPVIISVYSDDGKIAKVRVERMDFDEESLSSLDATGPLSSRGWTLQEAILSPRQLLYGNSQIYWSCLDTYRSADGMSSGRGFPSDNFKGIRRILHPDPDGSSKLADNRHAILQDYYDLVRSFSIRNLTYGSDKLPAFSALARSLQPAVTGDYLAGIWSSDIKSGLLWLPEVACCTHCKPFRAPSWSWAVTDGTVTFNYRPRPESQNGMKLLGYNIRPRDRLNKYGELEAASLIISGYTKPLIRSRQILNGRPTKGYVGTGIYDEKEKDFDTKEVNVMSELLLGESDSITGSFFVSMLSRYRAYTELEVIEIDPLAFDKEEYLLFLVHDDDYTDDGFAELVECLALRRVDGQVIDTFERAGWFKLYATNLVWLQSWQRQTVTLV